jgi:hypothetical protein
MCDIVDHLSLTKREITLCTTALCRWVLDMENSPWKQPDLEDVRMLLLVFRNIERKMEEKSKSMESDLETT